MSYLCSISFGQLVLGSEPRQRKHLRRFLLAACVYAFSMLLQLHAYFFWSQFAPISGVIEFVAFMGATVVVSYAVMRSPLSRRFTDLAVTIVQMVFAIVALALAYAINPHVRGMLLMIVALVLIYGSFNVTPRGCRQLGWFAVVALGLSMGLSWMRAPQLFPLFIESHHFLFSAVVLPTIAALAGQLSEMRDRLRSQKIELSGALERIRLLATRDELTGLPNRRHAQDLLALQATRAQSDQAPLTLCLIDIDHFKRVNDTLGHAAGDEVLRMVGRVAKPVLRDTDVLTRWGGEEFLLLLPDTHLADAELVVERLRARLASVETWSDRPELRVTFSGGITSHREGETMQETIARADDMLYRAKTAGRDRVLVAA